MSTIEGKVDGRTTRYQHRRPELLAAAEEYILDHGVAELRLRPLAGALGVTHATLLRHFGSKDQLVLEALASIRDRLFAGRGDPGAVGSLTSPADSMRAVWHHLCDPAERRQFVLLFELVALQTHEPGRFGSMAQVLIGGFLTPLEAAFRRAGATPTDAQHVATGFLALVRGLQLDLALTDDLPRVTAALHHYIDSVTRPWT